MDAFEAIEAILERVRKPQPGSAQAQLLALGRLSETARRSELARLDKQGKRALWERFQKECDALQEPAVPTEDSDAPISPWDKQDRKIVEFLDRLDNLDNTEWGRLLSLVADKLVQWDRICKEKMRDDLERLYALWKNLSPAERNALFATKKAASEAKKSAEPIWDRQQK